MKDKTFYRRNLPHLQPRNGVFAVTACLKGSLPKAKIQTLRDNRDLAIKEATTQSTSPEESKARIQQAREFYFGKFDALLDGATQGPTWLSQPSIAAIVQESLHFIDGRMCKIAAYTIMSNHIHLVLYKCEKPLFQVMESFKKYTGLRANNIIYGQHQKGDQRPSFWQSESYDHLVRDSSDFYNQILYTLNNPVKAGLVKHWQDWKWTYASPQVIARL